MLLGASMISLSLLSFYRANLQETKQRKNCKFDLQWFLKHLAIFELNNSLLQLQLAIKPCWSLTTLRVGKNLVYIRKNETCRYIEQKTTANSSTELIIINGHAVNYDVCMQRNRIYSVCPCMVIHLKPPPQNSKCLAAVKATGQLRNF